MQYNIILITGRKEGVDWLEFFSSKLASFLIIKHGDEYTIKKDNYWAIFSEYDNYEMYYDITKEYNGYEKFKIVRETFSDPFIALVESNGVFLINELIRNIDCNVRMIVDNDRGFIAYLPVIKELIRSNINWLEYKK